MIQSKSMGLLMGLLLVDGGPKKWPDGDWASVRLTTNWIESVFEVDAKSCSFHNECCALAFDDVETTKAWAVEVSVKSMLEEPSSEAVETE